MFVPSGLLFGPLGLLFGPLGLLFGPLGLFLRSGSGSIMISGCSQSTLVSKVQLYLIVFYLAKFGAFLAGIIFRLGSGS